MHGGWPYLDSTVALLNAYPQVHLELSAYDWADTAPKFDSYLKALIGYDMGKRILFGSDQMVWPEATGQAIARFRAARYLTDEQRHDIFIGNAVRLFGWRDLEGCAAKPQRGMLQATG